MQGIIAVVIVALPLAVGNAVCGHQPEGKAKVVHVSAKDRDGAWLGVAIQDVTKKLAEKKGLRSKEGAYVTEVVDESPADSAGINEGDVVVEFEGKSIATADDLMKAVTKTKPGTEVTVGIMREDQKKSIRVILGTPPRRREIRVVVPHIPPVPPIRFHQGSSLYGMRVMKLSDQLGEYFEAPSGKGVLVERVKKGSSAEKAGFKAGDVIARIGKKAIADLDDIWQAMEDYKDGEKVDVEIVRKGTRKTLTLEADESELGRGMHFRFHHVPHLFKNNDLEQLEELEGSELDSEEMRLEMEKAQQGIEEAKRAFDEADFQHEMEQLRRELKQIPAKIQENMKELREQLEKVKEQRNI
jgi:predicted metalloprotease with PDZ domain